MKLFIRTFTTLVVTAFFALGAFTAGCSLFGSNHSAASTPSPQATRVKSIGIQLANARNELSFHRGESPEVAAYWVGYVQFLWTQYSCQLSTLSPRELDNYLEKPMLLAGEQSYSSLESYKRAGDIFYNGLDEEYQGLDPNSAAAYKARAADAVRQTDFMCQK